MIYYIADMHFGHTNVIRFDNRPFADTEQMDEALIQNWNERVTADDTVYVLGDAFWRNEENSIRIMQQLNGHKHLIQGNHDRVKGTLRPYWDSIEQYAEINDKNRLVILSHYPIPFYKNQHYGAVMLYGHVHNTREWSLVEKWKNEQWAMGIPSRLINVGCMMDCMNYTPRTLDELLEANPVPAIERIRKESPQKPMQEKISMENYEAFIAEIDEVVKRIKGLYDLAYAQYSHVVDEVISGRLTDEKQIEHILDGIIDFGDDLRFLELSKKLCRHIYYEYPHLVGGFVHMYRALFEEKEDEDGIGDD